MFIFIFSLLFLLFNYLIYYYVVTYINFCCSIVNNISKHLYTLIIYLYYMSIELLQKLGLYKNEALIYHTLLELGNAHAGEISKKTQLNRNTVYDSLERLIKKGLVSFITSANRKLFKPANPAVILEQIKEKEKIANEIIPALTEIYMGSKEKEDSDIYRGRKGIRSVLNDILNYKEYVAFGSSGKFFQVMEHDFVIFQKKKEELKIKSRVIESESARKNAKLQKVAYAEFRFLSDKFTSPTTTVVYGNRVAIFMWGTLPVATVITSNEISRSYAAYFEALWETAKN
ncbi:MAG: helix-turn-helix domain-containing protein [Candidatus Woesearchaeota archaeon]